MKTFMMMAVFGIGFASVTSVQASGMTPHAPRIGSAQQEQEVTFPVGDDSQKTQAVHTSEKA